MTRKQSELFTDNTVLQLTPTSAEPVAVCDFETAWREIDDLEPEELLARIHGGKPITKPAECKQHGPLTQHGMTFGHWIAWLNCSVLRGVGWYGIGGDCAECHEIFQDPVNVTYYVLETTADCVIHGKGSLVIIFRVINEDGGRLRVIDGGGGRPEFRLERSWIFAPCPECDKNDSIVCSRLELTDKQWARGGKQIMAALAVARGTQRSWAHRMRSHRWLTDVDITDEDIPF